MTFDNDHEAKEYAQEWCLNHSCRYLSHEYYRHSDDRWNWLHIAIESGEGRSIVQLDLNRRDTWAGNIS